MKEVDAKFPVGEDGEWIDGDTLENVDNKKIHVVLYHAFTYQWYGYLGKGNQIQLGSCVENKTSYVQQHRRMSDTISKWLYYRKMSESACKG